MELHHHAIFVEAVSVAENGKNETIASHGGLDYIGDELVRALVGIVKAFSRKFRVAAEIEIRAVMDAFHFLPADRELILNISRLLRIMGKFVLAVRVETQF